MSLFKAGRLIDIRNTDPEFDTEERAMRAAEQMEREQGEWDDNAYAVWDAEDGDCLMILYRGKWYN